jgi:hypothetical protein
MSLHAWAIKYGIGPNAVAELQYLLGLVTPALPPESPAHGKSEAFSQSEVMLEASQKGYRLFRNNVGALKDENGRLVRYGLANTSKAVNEIIKSSDLIGWRPVLIQPQHVGMKIAQFVGREMKAPGWQFTGAEREGAQKAFIDMVNADGGNAAFATGKGTL